MATDFITKIPAGMAGFSAPDPEPIFARVVDILSSPEKGSERMAPGGSDPLPSVNALEEIMRNIRVVIFPDFFDRRRSCHALRPSIISIALEKIYSGLSVEISRALQFDCHKSAPEVDALADHLALLFIDALPTLRHLLYTDVQAVYDNDPAVDDYGEIILSYPVISAMIHYRVAHCLLESGVPVLPRMITELAHSATGIDINPGATIGEYFAIDHGTGVVIGQTCIIGNHVTIYQGVTLGAKNFTLDTEGHPLNIPRHPIIEDNVTIYSNASILGRITVGRNSVIGGNVWLTTSVPPDSRILQHQATPSPRR